MKVLAPFALLVAVGIGALVFFRSSSAPPRHLSPPPTRGDSTGSGKPAPASERLAGSALTMGGTTESQPPGGREGIQVGTNPHPGVSKTQPDPIPPQDAAFTIQYGGYSASDLMAARDEKNIVYKELRSSAYAEQRMAGDYVQVFPAPSGMTKRPDQIPKDYIHKAVVNPIEAQPDPSGRTVVWFISLDPGQYPDIYYLRDELRWLNSQIKSAAHTH